jgi:low temperature requirement protein LtrA
MLLELSFDLVLVFAITQVTGFVSVSYAGGSRPIVDVLFGMLPFVLGPKRSSTATQ